MVRRVSRRRLWIGLSVAYAVVAAGIVEGEHHPARPVPAAQPTLGRAWGPYQRGYGHAEPAVVFNGGDPTGLVTGIKWSSWGGPTARGVGTSDYVAQGSNVADGRSDPSLSWPSTSGSVAAS